MDTRSSNNGEPVVRETYADWLTLKDEQGTFFLLDRHSQLHIAPDCIDRLDALLDSMLVGRYDPQKLAVLMVVRACVKEIQRLETEGATPADKVL